MGSRDSSRRGTASQHANVLTLSAPARCRGVLLRLEALCNVRGSGQTAAASSSSSKFHPSRFLPARKMYLRNPKRGGTPRAGRPFAPRLCGRSPLAVGRRSAAAVCLGGHSYLFQWNHRFPPCFSPASVRDHQPGPWNILPAGAVGAGTLRGHVLEVTRL